MGFASLNPSCVLAAITFALASPALSQDAADFYRGKQVRMIVGHPVGGDYDIGGRLLAKSMARHIPGQPTIIVQNMPGAGSLRAANYLYVVAPKDGSTIGLFARGMAMQPLLDAQGVQFDAQKFNWIGRASCRERVFAVV